MTFYRSYVHGLVAAGLAAIAFSATPAAAEDMQFYGAVGYQRMEFDSTPVVNFNAIDLKAGVQINQYFGAEVQGDIGLGDQSVSSGGFTIKTKLNHFIGGFATASYPVAKQAGVFARVGYASVNVSANAGFGAVSGSDDGVAFGGGVRYFLKDGKNGFRAEYTRYKSDINAFGLSYVRRF